MLNKVLNFFKTYKKWFIYGGIAIVAIIILSSIQTCNKNRSFQNELKDEEILSLRLQLQTKDSIINKRDQTIILQTAVSVRDQKQIKAYSDSIFALKSKNTRKSDKILAHVTQGTKTKIVNTLVPYVDSLKFKKFSDSVMANCKEVIKYMKDSTVPTGTVSKDSTKDYEIAGTVTKKGFKIDSLSINDSTHLRFVEHKGGLLKRDSKGKRHFILKRSIEVQILHTNPLVKVTSLNSIFYTPKAKNKWVERVYASPIVLLKSPPARGAAASSPQPHGELPHV